MNILLHEETFARKHFCTNSRDNINYFDEEMYDEHVISDIEKYSYLKGPGDNISI